MSEQEEKGKKTKDSKSGSGTRITKAKVEEIIFYHDFECYYKKDGDTDFTLYDGCTMNLYMILHEGDTKVKLANPSSPYYSEEYQTVVMDAPCLSAIALIKVKK